MSKRRNQPGQGKGHSEITPVSRRLTVRAAVRRTLCSMAPGALALLASGAAVANPEGGVVVRGNAAISGGAGTLNVNQTTQRAVINWRDFSIGPQETVNFNQPSSTASTLNRITGGQRSLIEGALNANGRVYLINPSGVLFSRSSQINVGTLVATTGNITDDNFMSDRLQFHGAGSSGAVIENFGTISIRDGGLAALVAPTVRNAGVIQANLGRVALGGGESFTLDFYGDRLINFTVGEDSAPGTAPSVENSGALLADGGQVLLTTQTASDVVGGVVNMSGVIQARGVSRDASGSVILEAAGGETAVSGRIDASGTAVDTSGGRVELLGHSVNLQSGAIIDASGEAGGGRVHVGGPPANEVSSNRASIAVVEQGATIDASARDTGNGGTVSVWGTESATFAGEIASRGGEGSGDGGFVEVSSRGDLRFQGDVDTTAVAGRSGIVLLDPDTITVEQTGSSSTTASVIDGDALSNMLRRGMPVILDATDSITVKYIIDGRPLSGAASSGSIQMTAGAIIIKAPVISNNSAISVTATTGDVTIEGTGYLYVANGTGAVGAASINVTAEGAVRATGQLISLGTITLRARHNVQVDAALAGLSTIGGSTGVGSLTLISENAQISMAGATSKGSVQVQAAAGVTIAGGALTARESIQIDGGTGTVSIGAVAGDARIASLHAIDPDASVDITTSGGVDFQGSVLTSGGDISVGSDGAGDRPAYITSDPDAVLQAVSSTDDPAQVGSVNLSASGAVTVGEIVAGRSGGVSIEGGEVTVTASLAGLPGSADLDEDGEADGQGVGSLTIVSSGAVSLAGGLANGDVTVSAAGDITLGASTLGAAGMVTLTAGSGGDIVLNPIIDDRGTPADTLDDRHLAGINASGDVSLLAAGSGIVGSGIVTRDGDIRIDAGTAISVGAAAPVGGDADGIVDALISAGGDGQIVLTTPGTVSLAGSVVSAGGNICIGGGPGSPCATTSGPVGSLSTGSSVLVSAADPASQALGSSSTGRLTIDDERIWINAIGAADLGYLVAGFDGGVSLAAERVHVAGLIQGPEDLSTTDLDDRLGVGFLHVHSTGVAGGSTYDLDVAGANVAGFCASGGAAAECGADVDSMRLIVDAGGRAIIRGPLATGSGSVLIGRENPSAGPGDPNAFVALNTDTIVSAGAVRINANVTLWEGVDRWSVGLENPAAGIGLDVLHGSLEPWPDPEDFSGKDMTEADRLAAAWLALNPDGCCLYQYVAFNQGEGAPPILDGLLYTDDAANPNFQYDIGEENSSCAGSYSDCWGGGPDGYSPIGNWARRETIVAVDTEGRPVQGVNSQSCQGGGSALVCGLNLDAPLDAEAARTDFRAAFWQQQDEDSNPPYLVTRISAGTDIVINGDVTRYDACEGGCVLTSQDYGVEFILPSALGHRLELDAGGRTSISGRLSDSVDQALRTGFWIEDGGDIRPVEDFTCADGQSCGLPGTGRVLQASPFIVEIKSEYDIGEAGYVMLALPEQGSLVWPFEWGFAQAIPVKGLYEDEFGAPNTDIDGDGIEDISVVTVTSPTYSVGSCCTTSDIGAPPSDFIPSGGSDSPPNFVDLNPGFDAGGSAQAPPPQAGVDPFDPPQSGDVVSSSDVSTWESDSRLTDELTEDEDSGSNDENDTDRCPRGAGSLADLGRTGGVYGAAPDVYSRCDELATLR